MVKGILTLEFPHSHNFTRKLSTGVNTFSDLEDVVANNDNIGIGDDVLQNTTSNGVIAIGANAGNDGPSVNDNSVMIGTNSNSTGAGEQSVALGYRSFSEGQYSVSVGPNSFSGGVGSVALGVGSNASGSNSLAISDFSFAPGDNSISIGNGSGPTNGTPSQTINIGKSVGNSDNVSDHSISIGGVEGNIFTSATSQNGIGYGSIAIGSSCNSVADTSDKRGMLSIMVGSACCLNGVGAGVTALGVVSGLANAPSNNTVLIGHESGQGTTSAVEENSVSIGYQAGKTGAGSSSVLIGQAAQGLNDNCIVLNASGSVTTTVEDGSCYINPIKEETTVSLENHLNLPTTATGFTHVLVFNPTTKEIRAVPQPTIL